MDKEIICSFENLYRAYRKAKAGKGFNGSSTRFQMMTLEGVHLLKEQLEEQTYQMAPYNEFKIYEPKERVIQSCSFKDKVVQHCLCDNILHPRLANEFIKCNYAGQIGKGTLFGMDKLKGQVRRVFLNGKTRLMTPYLKKMNKSQRLVVKLTKDGKAKEVALLQIIAETFHGKCPDGYVPCHKNGMQGDNCANNIVYISRRELGRKTGPQSRRRPVAKIGLDGTVIEFYPSARQCAKKNFCSYQTVTDRCNGKVKSTLGQIDFYWDDDERSKEMALARVAK